MSKNIRIALDGVADDYRESLIPILIESLGYKITWSNTNSAELIIIGPFYDPRNKNRWIPRPLRKFYTESVEIIQTGNNAITLFQTGENLRHNHFEANYSISFDHCPEFKNNYRFPYWMELIDWSSEGVTGNINPRFGKLLSIERLMRPLGKKFLTKPRAAAIFASHLREPRRTIINAVRQHAKVEGFGPAFDSKIIHHSKSSFTKSAVLENFSFNLCPENSLYPGYYTEKMPEAFMADCLPITWADVNIPLDFNPNALINLSPMVKENFESLGELLQSNKKLNEFSEQPLLLIRPTITPLKEFIGEILRQAKS